MTMPGMTGDQLVRELLRIRPDIPVILCTGFSERMDEERAQSAGFRAYAMKPLERKKLAITVRRVLDQKT
jgi:CheY-like chemotaxis protein